jgi:hypothetical protein
MDTTVLAVIVVSIVALASLIGIFRTKTPGFGRFSTSLLLLVLVLFAASIFVAIGRLDGQQFGNILFAVAGFAGGLITGKANES